MFGNCLWFKLKDNHNLNTIINNFSNKFKTDKYKAHFTILYNFKNDINLDDYELQDYYKVGKMYQTKNGNFYAIQQDYKDKNNNVKHISLAYKINNKFTDIELNYLNSQNIDMIIRKNELIKVKMNCNSIYTNEWFKLN